MESLARARELGVSAEEALDLLEVTHRLARASDLASLGREACAAVRALLGADGGTFVLSEGPMVYYAEEDAPGRLWKGRRFSAQQCISGWAITEREPAAIVDVYTDARVPIDAYKPTFVKSLAMMPTAGRGADAPRGALGAYWTERHVPTEREMVLLRSIADAARIGIDRADLREEVDRLRAICPEEPAPLRPEVRSDLLAVVAHDLRNPLGAIRHGMELLLEVAPDETCRSLAQRSLRSAEKADRLLAQLLDFVEVERQGGLPLEVAEVDVAAVVHQVVDEQRLTHPEADVRATIDPVTARCDADRIAEALSNLVRNAVQHGAPEAPLTVRLRAEDDAFRLEVHNRGDVIPADRVEAIFEPFRRERTRSGRSLGLGLYITRQIARAHGGRVEVSSSAEAGTRFALVVPRGAAALTG